MALSEKHRSELYQYFEPELGDEVTEAFLKEFPKGNSDELVTREYLDLRLQAFKGEMAALFVGFSTLIIAALAVCTTIIVAAN
jgi:hypothetical protein